MLVGLKCKMQSEVLTFLLVHLASAYLWMLFLVGHLVDEHTPK